MMDISGTNIKHITVFDRQYTPEKQAEGLAISQAIWTGCHACKHWDSADNWCNKHDRSADSCDGCSTPEWRGLHK